MDALFAADTGTIMALIAALLATGVVAGVLAGLLGVGGGIVIVPMLYHLFTLIGVDEGVRMHVAVGTSLATIIPTSISSIRAHWKRGSVDLELLKRWGPWVFVGVVIGTVVGGNVGGAALAGVFAVVALLVSSNMAFRKEGWTVRDTLPSVPGAGAHGDGDRRNIGDDGHWRRHAVGAYAFGLRLFHPSRGGHGGGHRAYHWRSRRHRVSGLRSGGERAAAREPVGYVNLIGFAVIVPCTVLAAPLGAKIAHTINPRMLRAAFALFLFATAMRMIYGLVAG